MQGRIVVLDVFHCAIAEGEGNRTANAVEAVAASYAEDITDEFVVPTVVERDGKPVGTVNENSSMQKVLVISLARSGRRYGAYFRERLYGSAGEQDEGNWRR